MNKRIKNAHIVVLLMLIAHAALVVGTYFFFNKLFPIACLVGLIVDIIALVVVINRYVKEKWNIKDVIGSILPNGAKEAMLLANSGLIIYDDEYTITYASEMFEERNMHIVGEKLHKALPKSEQVLDGAHKAVCVYNGKIYQLNKSLTSHIIYFTDITEVTTLAKKYRDEMNVLGIVNFDNYEESISFEDETKIARINMAIIQPVLRYVEKYHGIVKKLRADRYLVIMNNSDLEDMIEDKFSINETVKQIAEKMNVNITVSMAFGCGSNDLTKIDEAYSDAMEMVLGRGGDQVAVKDVNDTIKFYGNSSESNRDNSKVKARMIALALRDLIKTSQNVVVIPHNYADYDAIGGCIGVKKIVEAYGKKAYMLLNDVNIEKQAHAQFNNHVLVNYDPQTIIDSSTALEMIDDNTLVIVVDHHSLDQSAAREVVEKSHSTVVIDHHRRKDEERIKASLMYIDPSASSVVEMITELMQYQAENISLSEIEATYMYTGLLVDTDNLKKRCSARTFETCAYLRKAEADINESNNWLKDNILTFVNKTNFMGNCIAITNNIVVATYPYKNDVVDRTLCAIVANELLTIKDVEASFAIGKTSEDVVGISARSNGTINVQLILENMGGGGHFNMAACQLKDVTVEQAKEMLIKNINEYLKGVQNDESNITK